MNTLVGDVPADWEIARLGEACDILTGPSGASLQPQVLGSSGVPVVAPKDMKDNRIVADKLAFVGAEIAEKLHRYRLAPGDIVAVRTGEVGRHALVGRPQAGWLFGTGCLRLRSRGVARPGYVAYYLNHPAVRDWIRRNATGSAIPSVSAATLQVLPLVLPPLVVQSSVDEILGTLDEQIAIHDQVSRAASRLRDALLPLLIIGAVPLDNRHALG